MLVLAVSNRDLNDASLVGIGARLKAARLRAGYRSQCALARVMRTNNMNIHRHETEAVVPSDAMVKAYAETLGVSVAWLRYGRETSTVVPAAVETYLSSVRGMDTDASVAAALRRLDWTAWTGVSASEVDHKDVETIRDALEKMYARRGKLVDGSPGLPRAPGGASSRPA
jgi:hypothetical protein